MRLLLAAGLVACACSPGAFACEDVDDCRDGAREGVCQADGFCSFPDVECPSGQRYGDHSGGLAGQCVMPQGDTEGTSSTAAPTSTSDPTSLDVSSASITVASESEASDAGVDTTQGVTTLPGSTDDGVSDGSSTTGIVPTGPELALWLELDDVAFASGLVDSGPLDHPVACASEGACPTEVPGRFGQGAEFHGAGECIVVPYHEAFSDFTALTVSAWMKLADGGIETNRMIAGKAYGDEYNNTFELYTYDVTFDDGVQRAWFNATDGVDSPGAGSLRDTPIDEWTHVAGTWDGAAIALWVGGAQVATAPLAVLAVDDHEVRIGCDDDLGGEVLDNVFVGAIDDVRIYREALDPEQIAALAAGEEP